MKRLLQFETQLQLDQECLKTAGADSKGERLSAA